MLIPWLTTNLIQPFKSIQQDELDDHDCSEDSLSNDEVAYIKEYEWKQSKAPLSTDHDFCQMQTEYQPSQKTWRNYHRENNLQSDHSQNQRESEQHLANNHSEYHSQYLQMEPDSHPSVLNPSYQQRVHRRDRPSPSIFTRDTVSNRMPIGSLKRARSLH